MLTEPLCKKILNSKIYDLFVRTIKSLGYGHTERISIWFELSLATEMFDTVDIPWAPLKWVRGDIFTSDTADVPSNRSLDKGNKTRLPRRSPHTSTCRYSTTIFSEQNSPRAEEVHQTKSKFSWLKDLNLRLLGKSF